MSEIEGAMKDIFGDASALILERLHAEVDSSRRK